jgi:hypothetical protein
MKITPWQNQIICGTLLGSGYISRTKPTYLGISESHNHEWLVYKGQELQSLEARTPISESGKVVKWRSKSNEIWLSYGEKFYKEGKKTVDMELLNGLRDIALAIWYGDKGFWYSNRRMGLRTTAFGDSNLTLWKYFNEVGMPCDRKVDSHGATRIVFTREGTHRFLTTVAHRLPDFMHHRLDSDFRN